MEQRQQQHSAAIRVSWYARRLALMSLPELAWRCSQVGRQVMPQRNLLTASTAELLGPGRDWVTALKSFRSRDGRSLLLDRERAEDIAVRHHESVAALVSAAERVVAGRVTFFGYPEGRLSTPVDWNHDPVNDVRWPLLASSRIDHRVWAGDPKWIWELNRVQHLPWLAQAWLFTGEERFAETALSHLDSWIDQNPWGRGINWRGAFEGGIRSISIVVALQGLRDSPALTVPRFERIVRMLAGTADRCWSDRSRFSSANNHVVGELAGLAAIAIALPELTLAAHWERAALRQLSIEASQQILADGASAEQALGYQLFTGELLLVVAAMLRSRGDEVPVALTAALDRSSRYLTGLLGPGEPEPRYGDSDEGFALRLGPEPVRTIRDHLGVVGAFTGDARARQAGGATLSSAWMSVVPGTPSARGRSAQHDSEGERGFVAPEGGMVVLRSAGRRVMMDVGPLGYLSIAAHGYADALSVTLSIEGQDIVGDPGTASYYGHPKWREAHRGTRAHATVTVDGENQSLIAGPFMWTDHAHVRTRAVDVQRGIVDAEHDGYRRLPDPVTHRRWLVAPPEQSTVLVVDLVDGTADHEMRVSWPLHPSLDVWELPNGHLLSRGGAPVIHVAYSSLGAIRLEQVKGDVASNLGWWSRRLESREPSWLVSCRARGVGRLVTATLFGPVAAGDAELFSRVSVTTEGDDIVTTWNEGGRTRVVSIDSRQSGGVRQSGASRSGTPVR